MSDTPSPSTPAQDPGAALDTLVPQAPAERRRAFAALLRAINDERQAGSRSSDAPR